MRALHRQSWGAAGPKIHLGLGGERCPRGIAEVRAGEWSWAGAAQLLPVGQGQNPHPSTEPLPWPQRRAAASGLILFVFYMGFRDHWFSF